MASADKAPGTLDGVRVRDCTAMMSGPCATGLMADSGAEVIQIEPPEGDHSRTRPPTGNGHSTSYPTTSTGDKP